MLVTLFQEPKVGETTGYFSGLAPTFPELVAATMWLVRTVGIGWIGTETVHRVRHCEGGCHVICNILPVSAHSPLECDAASKKCTEDASLDCEDLGGTLWCCKLTVAVLR